jgi:signal transduction histidine kinase
MSNDTLQDGASERRMDIYKAELHASGFRAIVEVYRSELGAEALADMLKSLGVTEQEVSAPNAWLSMRLGEEMLDRVIKGSRDGEAVIRRMMKLALSPQHMGFAHPLFRAVGSPMLFYTAIAKMAARVNRVLDMSATTIGPNRMRITVRRRPEAPVEMYPWLCKCREAQIAEAPTIFGLPPSRIEHPECMLRGDDACVYDVQVPDYRRPILSFSGLVLGALGSAWLVGHLGVNAPALVLSAALVSGGWALGRIFEVERTLNLKLDDLNSTYGALEEITKSYERRHAELVEAKAEVEQKVEQRTHELRLTTQQLSETLSQIQELDRAKTAFFANVSHDLRTPLTLILGPLGEMSAGREPPGGLVQSVDVMQRNGMRLLDLINQLLDLAKIDAGKMQIARNPTNVVDLARNVEGRFAAAAAQKGVALTTNVVAILPIAIDSTWIENALTNLVANAMRFAESKVAIKVREENGSVVLEVEDDGQGIAEKDLDSVFDRFAQGSDIQARKGGTGLGLAIVREAARLHGGEASVRSVPGVATTFTLTLPRAMAANTAGESVRSPASASNAPNWLNAATVPQSGVVQSAKPAEADEQLEWPGPDPSAPLIIVAEDDDDLRSFTSSVLANTYRVRATRNGEEALALIGDLHPDAVVSDVVMPKMNGYDLCKALRKRDDTRTLPVILLTARRDVGRVLEGFEAGADDYVTKPFQARELLARVNVHVRLRRIVSEMAHRERLASLGVLAASLAHQVRNPLNAILAGLPAVRRKLAAAISPRDDDMFGAMISSGERINTLIKDLMDLSRVDQEGVSRFRPAEGVRSCIRLIEARIQGPVHMDAELDDAIEIQGKAGDLSHVFLNLIDNAVRAAEPSGRIHLVIERRGESFVFEIGDSGTGIPSDKHEAVFAPFYTTRAAGEGTGLGLAIARQVVIQHGGTITIGRSPLGGALFTVALPSAAGTESPVASATVH